jgi:hypothetical protein
MHVFITQLCRQQAKVIRNNSNATARKTGQGEAMHKKFKRLKHGGGQAHDHSSD